ncbi:MAG: hypothetical protein ACREOK_02405 [Gemmatimonadaceae bacterium]
MRSLGSVLRGIAITALILWIVNALVPRSGSPTLVRGDALSDELPRLTSSATGIAARLDHVPGARERDWLAALRDAGVVVQWTGDLAPVALETYPAADPSGGTFVLVSAPARSAVGDSLGAIDTLDVARAVVRVGDVRGGITLTSGSQTARAPIAPAIAPRRVLVAGSASWEAKFVIAALEEAGWQVDARLRVRPDEAVGGPVTPDTARHSAVVLLDTSARLPGGLDAFVRAGGGVLLAGAASRLQVASALVGWRVARRETAPLGTVPDDTLWRGQSRVVFGDVDTSRAIVLERRGANPVIVARRHYAGRVLAIGYDETWRWRMAGGANSVAEHRAWWSRHVASVAFRAAPARNLATGSAPLAALHALLGPAVSAALPASSWPRALLGNLLGAIALAALLGEWFLRRLRGAR